MEKKTPKRKPRKRKPSNILSIEEPKIPPQDADTIVNQCRKNFCRGNSELITISFETWEKIFTTYYHQQGIIAGKPRKSVKEGTLVGVSIYGNAIEINEN